MAKNASTPNADKKNVRSAKKSDSSASLPKQNELSFPTANAPAKAEQRKGLGKGLGALLPGFDLLDSAPSHTGGDAPSDSPDNSVVTLKVINLEPNKDQPRRNFDPDALQNLAESIGQHGMFQPILVKKRENGLYQIIAGERRWRAAKLAGLKEVPCIIRNYDEQQILEIALIENLQREDLNPIEEAEGYKTLMLNFGLTQEMISDRIGKSRSAVANALRLNNLPSVVKEMLVDERLTSGHARAILSLNDEGKQIELAEKIIAEGLNVRQAEAVAQGITEKPEKVLNKVDKAMVRYFIDVEKMLSGKLSTKVKIHSGKNKGRIEIEYYTREDLERLVDFFNERG